MSQWVKVTEERKGPDTTGFYIVFAESADPELPLKVMVWWNQDKQEWGLVEYWKNKVSHWMPMPDDPEEECVPSPPLYDLLTRGVGFEKLQATVPPGYVGTAASGDIQDELRRTYRRR